MRLQVEYVMMALKNPADFQKMSFVVCHGHSCLKDGKFNLFFSSFLPFLLFFCPRTGSHSLAMEVNSTLQLQEKSILQTVEIHQLKTTMAFVR